MIQSQFQTVDHGCCTLSYGEVLSLDTVAKTPRVSRLLFLGRAGGKRGEWRWVGEGKKEYNKRLIKGDMQKRGMCASWSVRSDALC